MHNIKILLFLGLLLPASPVRPADTSGVVLESQTDKTQITIGDQIQYQVTFTGPAGATVEMPGLGVQLGQFEIKDYEEAPLVTRPDSTVQWSVRYHISTYAVGKYIIPPLPVKYTLRGDSTAHVLLADQIAVEVKPISVADTTDIVGIHGPVPAGRSYLKLGLILAALGLLLAGGGVYLWRRRQALLARLKPAPPPRPAHETALAELAALEQSEAARQEDSRPFCLKLSEIQRRYIKARYGLDALESTTPELEQHLRDRHFSAEDTRRIITYCQALDLVKFAQQPAGPEVRQEQVQGLRQYILDTVPAPAAAPAPGA
jgi:hypothetical protein